MTAQHNALPTSMFDAPAFSALLDNGDQINCCKQAIATATQYQYDKFRAGATAGDLIRQLGVYTAVYARKIGFIGVQRSL